MIEHNLTEWAESLGVNYHALKAAMTRAGIEVAARQPVTAMQIKVAILGDERAEKVRNLKLDADLKQAELATLEGRLLEPGIVQERIDAALGLVRQAVLQAEAELPPRCNPQDHAMARRAVSQWVDRFFSWVRDGLSRTALEWVRYWWGLCTEEDRKQFADENMRAVFPLGEGGNG